MVEKGSALGFHVFRCRGPPEAAEPVMRQAKKEKKRAKLVRDVLYIEGEIYTPPTESARQTASTRQTGPSHASQQTPRSDRQPNKRQRQGSTPSGK